MICSECGTEWTEYFYEKDEKMICEDCLFEVEQLDSERRYFLDGEYIGCDSNIEEVYHNICEMRGYNEIKNERESYVDFKR